MAAKDRVATYENDVLFDDATAPSYQPQQDYFSIVPGVPNVSKSTRLQRRSKFIEVDVDGESEADGRSPCVPLHHTNCAARPRSASQQSVSDCDSEDDPLMAASRGFSLHPRLYLTALLLLIAIPLLYENPWLAASGVSIIGARAGVVRRSDATSGSPARTELQRRANTDTDVCSRFAAQSAVVNGTVYVYGGHATTDQGQKNGTWTNDFFTVDLTKSWNISNPTMNGLPQPSGPPAVANGFLWNSYDSLYLYGGIYSDSPPATPDPFSLWEYQIKAAKWVEHSNPQTSNGINSDGGNQPVQRTGEGAGVSVPELGRGFFFAGHLDHYTTPGWSIQVARVYLKSLLEYTFPGYSNDGVQDLAGGKTAGSDGVWRNVTQGGIQDTAKFPSRADGALVFVPGFGAQGILLSIGGGIASPDGQEDSFVSPLMRRSIVLPLTIRLKVANERH